MKMLSEKTFEPMTVTYAITSGVAVEGKPDTFLFTYSLYQLNEGFADALAGVVGPIKVLTKQEGVAPSEPTKVYHHDGDNLIGIDLFHPSYKPFGCDVPLISIKTQLLDEELESEITKEVTNVTRAVADTGLLETTRGNAESVAKSDTETE